MQWNLQNHSLPVQTFARLYNPNGADMVEFFPVQGFYGIEPNIGFDAWLQNQAQQREAAYRFDQMRRQQEQNAGSTYTTSDAFGDYIMGRETYNDPYYQHGSQHTGYHKSVWTDGQGNYQYGDASFNPNNNSSVAWTRMEKKQIGQ